MIESIFIDYTTAKADYHTQLYFALFSKLNEYPKTIQRRLKIDNTKLRYFCLPIFIYISKGSHKTS